ncbi:MAG: DUF362 domain-containing protein [Thermoleophilia bacterium]
MPEVRPSTVAVFRCPGYEEELVRRAVAAAVEAIGGIDDIIRPGDKVLLKANLLAPADPGEAVTTHPAVVRAVIEAVKEAGGVPVVGDSPGYFTRAAGAKCPALSQCGLKQVADDLGIESFQFEAMEDSFIETEVPGGVYLDRIYAARLALEADVIITLPKLKTHSNTWYTGAVKNMFGAVATRTRKEAHKLSTLERFSSSIVDIYSVFKPQLAIMDAVIGMEGEGPRHGMPKLAGLILAAKDPVALDAVASKIIGFDPLEIITTREASARGLGAGELGDIAIAGERIEDVAVDFRKPSGRMVNIPPFVMRVADRLLKVQPNCVNEDCDRCAICKKSCPVDAISMNPFPEIDRDRCIECYCCNEMCPTGAMQIKKSWLAALVSGKV